MFGEKVFNAAAVPPQDHLEVIGLLAVALLQPLHLLKTSVDLMVGWLSLELVLEAIMMVVGGIFTRFVANAIFERLEVLLHFGLGDFLVHDLLMNSLGELVCDLSPGHHLRAREMVFLSAVLFDAVLHDDSTGLDLIVEVDRGEFDILGEGEREDVVLRDVRRLKMEEVLDGGRPDNDVVIHHRAELFFDLPELGEVAMFGRGGRLAGHHDDVAHTSALHRVNGSVGGLHTASLGFGIEQNPVGTFKRLFVARRVVGIDFDDFDVLLLAVFKAIGVASGENNLFELMAMMLYHARGGVVAKVVVGSGDDEVSFVGCGHDALGLSVGVFDCVKVKDEWMKGMLKAMVG